jgi:hypothetical protein
MASISAVSRPLVWTREPGIRLRPVPEQAVCLAYRPKPPMLFGLNLTSWLVLTLCDGRSEAAIGHDYHAAVREAGGPGAAPGAFAKALQGLEELKLIRRDHAAAATNECQEGSTT